MNLEAKPLLDYATEIFEQAIRADELICSLKMIVDFYELKTMQKEEKEMEETEQLEELSIDKVSERMLASKLRPELSESEEYKPLSKFLSQISKKNS